MKQEIRINENQLHDIIKESMNDVLNEYANNGVIDAIKGAWQGAKRGKSDLDNEDYIRRQQHNGATKVFKLVQEGYLALRNAQGNDEYLKKAKRYIQKAYQTIKELYSADVF